MSKRGIKPGQTFSEQHKARIREGLRAARERRLALQAEFALKVLAALKDHKE